MPFGMVNRANICWFNSMFQILMANPVLRDYVAKFTEEEGEAALKAWLAVLKDKDGPKVDTAHRTILHMRIYLDAATSAETPITASADFSGLAFAIMRNYFERPTLGTQEDAMEAYRFVTEGMATYMTPPMSVEDSKSLLEEGKSDPAMSTLHDTVRYLDMDGNPRLPRIEGRLLSDSMLCSTKMTCAHDDCGASRSIFSRSRSLNVPIIVNGESTVALEDCLAGYLHREKMPEGSVATCETCKKQGAHYSQICLHTAPDTLVISLKRFEHRHTARGYMQFRLNMEVAYKEDLTIHTENDGDAKYELYAVLNHHGAINSGHYTAYIKWSDGMWYHADDSIISPCYYTSHDDAEKKVSTDQPFCPSREVYSLFYAKVGSPAYLPHALKADSYHPEPPRRGRTVRVIGTDGQDRYLNVGPRPLPHDEVEDERQVARAAAAHRESMLQALHDREIGRHIHGEETDLRDLRDRNGEALIKSMWEAAWGENDWDTRGGPPMAADLEIRRMMEDSTSILGHPAETKDVDDKTLPDGVSGESENDEDHPWYINDGDGEEEEEEDADDSERRREEEEEHELIPTTRARAKFAIYRGPVEISSSDEEDRGSSRPRPKPASVGRDFPSELFLAVSRNDVKAVLSILKMKPHVVNTINPHRQTPIMLSRSVEMAVILWQRDAKMNAEDAVGMTVRSYLRPLNLNESLLAAMFK